MSLRDQLAQVAAANSTVALDRKRRQKLHSASLIYNPKTAATQDYDFIFENASSALRDLIEIDARFETFSQSLFNPSSVSIDRNVQTKEQVKDLDNAVNLFLMLSSSRWHLTPTLHAVEWLVRRFQIHIHNAECLLLSTINYYQAPVFKRILNIVKLPPLFNPLSNFVRTEKMPTSLTIIKLFNDMDFLRLYTNYLSTTIKQKVTYTNQLLFTTCSLINLVAFNSGDENSLTKLVPIILEVSAKLLVSSSVDCQIAAHTVLVVFATALPLSKEIVLAATETILANLTNGKAKRSALISICKLFQTLRGQGNVDQLPPSIYKLFDSRFDFDFLGEFLDKKEKVPVDKFITTYIRAVARYDHDKLDHLVPLLKGVKLEKFEVRLIITDLIHLSEVIEDKSQLINIFEYFISINEDMVLRCLGSLNLSAELFEMRLTTSIFAANRAIDDTPIDIEPAKVIGASKSVESFKEFLNKNSEHINTKNTSMLIEDDQKFGKLLSLFVEAVSKKYQPLLFLSSFFTTMEGRLTFLLRVTVSPASPVALRLISLNTLSKLINQIDHETNVFTLVPILITALSDISKNVRSSVKKILTQILKRPFTKHYFLANKIYGDLDVPMLSPKDSQTWLEDFLREYLIENYDISNVFIPKKNEKIYLIFWANQTLFMPLPYSKMTLLRFITSHPSYGSTYSQLFEGFFKSYLTQRSSWESKCEANKTSFHDFESAIVSTIAPKEKSKAIIDFIMDALKSDFTQLANLIADRLITIYPTLKFNQQLQLVQNIIDTTAECDLSYDSVNLLQSLPLGTDIFVATLSHYRINSDEDSNDLNKRRRRRSSTTNKMALQKEEVSQIAEVHLRKLTILLEALDKSKVTGTEPLLSGLFNILSDLETLDQDGGLPVLYVQETISSCMLETIESLKANSDADLGSIRADILVSAISSSQSPQVQNKLLLVIGALATVNPEIVLHSVMPIFIFMGAHTIRQDDEFSTYVVEKTIRTVVPALLKSNSSNKKDETELLLMSFATAFAHVPKHRRVRLFTSLVNTLDAHETIGPFMFLISQQYSSQINKFKVAESKSLIEFMRAFMNKFSVLDQIHGLEEFFGLLNVVTTETSSEVKESMTARTIFSNGIMNFTFSEAVSLKKNALDFIDKVIENNEAQFRGTNSLKLGITSALWDSELDKEFTNSLRAEYSKLLQTILDSINDIENTSSGNVVTEDESFSDNDYEDHMKDISDILFSLLGHVLDLLPIKDFVSAVLPLISKDSKEEIRNRLTMVIASKFDLEPMESLNCADEVMKALFKNINIQIEEASLVQVSLNAVSSLISKFGDKLDSENLIQTLKISSVTLLSGKVEIIISSLAAVTNVIHAIGVKSIAFYPKIVPPTLKIFDTFEDSSEELDEELQLAILLLFSSMVKRMPAFLMSNLVDVLRVIFSSNRVQDSVRLSIISLVVEQIDLKEVMKALYKVWLSDISKAKDAVSVSLFLSCLESVVDAIDKKAATSQSPTFFKLLLSLFEYRSISIFDHNTVSRLEASVHQIANTYVLKLNDKVFRPLFAITVRWAFDGEGTVSTTITKNERLIAFFKFFNKLQENLRSIVTSYFTYLLDPVTALLKSFISGELSDVNLRRLVLNSLTSCFKYDRDEYWKSTSRFELVSENLVNQLSNIEDSIGKYLVKAISSLAVNNNGVDEHNKTMNVLLISHMKSSCKNREKYWAVRSIKLIYSKVGEGWLVLLPQLVPTIAELLEDDDEDVEFEVRTGLVKVVENVLGEPFDRYLD